MRTSPKEIKAMRKHGCPVLDSGRDHHDGSRGACQTSETKRSRKRIRKKNREALTGSIRKTGLWSLHGSGIPECEKLVFAGYGT
jgi:hypothetical protein